MSEKAQKRPITVELTSEQQELARQSTGRDVREPELAPEELEERVAPRLK
jgi:hypothetical protein